MTLNELVDVMSREEDILISYWDVNMSMSRDIDEENLHRFISAHGNTEIRKITPKNHKILVEIANPN